MTLLVCLTVITINCHHSLLLISLNHSNFNLCKNVKSEIFKTKIIQYVIRSCKLSSIRFITTPFNSNTGLLLEKSGLHFFTVIHKIFSKNTMKYKLIFFQRLLSKLRICVHLHNFTKQESSNFDELLRNFVQKTFENSHTILEHFMIISG
jgi:hypothetical protein